MEMTSKPVTREQEKQILRMIDTHNHGKDYKTETFEIYCYQIWLKDPVTGHNDYGAYRLNFLTFINEPKENLGVMPKYYESHDIKRIVHWLKKKLGW